MNRVLLAVMVVVLGLAVASNWWFTREAVNGAEGRLAEAWQGVQQSPTQGDAWLLLGDAQAALDQSLAAEQSYLTSQRLNPSKGDVYGRLGFLYYGLEREEEAWKFLKEAERRGVELPMMDWTLAYLRQKFGDVKKSEAGPQPDKALEPEVTAAAVASDCSLNLVRRGKRGIYTAPVMIGEEMVLLVVDTGATRTVLSSELAERIELDIDDSEMIRAMTAAGPSDFWVAHNVEISFPGRTATLPTVAICDVCTYDGVDGLMGLDLHDALQMELDLGNGKILFRDCREAQ